MWPNYAFHVPAQKKLRYLVHTDCKNEADDQFTLAHILMTDKLDVRGIIAGHFDEANYGRCPEHQTAQASLDEIHKILDLMDLAGKFPVLKGAETGIADEQTPIVTEAARFIVEEAMRDDPRPLYIGMQGAITDLACAILMEPRICERMTCIWIGGADYPEGGFEFNLMSDINAANVVFSSSMPLWQVPIGTYKQFAVSLAELQSRVLPYGSIGRYLFSQMAELNDSLASQPDWPHGETWCLGDEGVICALLEDRERRGGYTEIPAPRIGSDMRYLPGDPGRKIRVYRTMDVRLDLEDLYAKLRINFPENKQESAGGKHGFII